MRRSFRYIFALDTSLEIILTKETSLAFHRGGGGGEWGGFSERKEFAPSLVRSYNEFK